MYLLLQTCQVDDPKCKCVNNCFKDSVEDGEAVVQTALENFGRIGKYCFLKLSVCICLQLLYKQCSGLIDELTVAVYLPLKLFSLIVIVHVLFIQISSSITLVSSVTDHSPEQVTPTGVSSYFKSSQQYIVVKVVYVCF